MTTDVEQALNILRERGAAGPVSTAIVLGTGLGSLVENVDDAISVPYEDLPGFPTSDVSGHRQPGRRTGRRPERPNPLL